MNPQAWPSSFIGTSTINEDRFRQSRYFAKAETIYLTAAFHLHNNGVKSKPYTHNI